MPYHESVKMTWYSTARLIYSERGLRGFARGIVPCAARAIPACASMFATVDIVRATLTDLVENDELTWGRSRLTLCEGNARVHSVDMDDLVHTHAGNVRAQAVTRAQAQYLCGDEVAQRCV
jgi:Mitochondrial carrier protein